ncbi:hypothetical protein MTR67_047852 [Solanum verrucosum]|uniref:NB-ARC domain-containing protein n=1 Tax=Solanum verrucosum TaxID=315347 RepID=A0AAF0ZVZ3_SOLVR|nr:hypothetical protein MTR67_047852 [Solanum verrucosum]
MILQEIFSQVTGSKDKGDKDDILADMLRKSLMGKRYLIVLDDMWDCMEWDNLRLCFPDIGNISRIVVTTRLEKVDRLKPCLLYMGMFPEEARITGSKLISLWIAEDFVVNTESAEDYLMDLISSNVVMVSKKEYNGKGNHSQFQPCDLKESRVSFNLSKEHSKFASLGSKTRKPFHQQLRSPITIRKSFDGIPLRVDVLSRRCPNLQQLHITFRGDNDSSESFCLTLENLTQLQLASNLKKLVLRGTRIENMVPFIAGLSSLEYLQLWNSDYFESEEWCLGDITLYKLKFLNLTHLRISRWDASEESFPLLETLVIKECYNLEEIPLIFADIPTLKQSKLIRCKNKSLEALALRIKEDVEENEGNDRIDLIIKITLCLVSVRQFDSKTSACNHKPVEFPDYKKAYDKALQI